MKRNKKTQGNNQEKQKVNRNRNTGDPCKRVIKFYFKIAMLFYDIKIEQKYD